MELQSLASCWHRCCLRCFIPLSPAHTSYDLASHLAGLLVLVRHIITTHASTHTSHPCPAAGSSSTSGFSPADDDSDDEDPLIRELEEKERQMARELKDFDSVLAERERERRREEWRKGRGL